MSAFQFAIGETWIIDGTLHDEMGNPLPAVGTLVEFRMWTPFGSLDLDNTTPAVFFTNELLGAIQIVIRPLDQPVGLLEGVYEFEVWATLATGVISQQEWGTITALSAL